MRQKFVAVVGSITLLGSAHAQDREYLEEVVVTAEKIAQSVDKAPITVTVFDQAKLQEMGAQSFVDYAASVPALSFQSLAPGRQRVLLRGVSDGVGTGLRGSTQNVTGIYIDDMVVSNNSTAPDLNLFDVERVEVLKGPQGTLYGDGSVGGLLRVITNKADATRTAGLVEVSGGSVSEGGEDYSVNGMFNLPLVQDTLALRLTGQYRNVSGFIDDVRSGQEDVNDLEQTGGRFSLRWQPQENLAITASMLYQKTELGSSNDYNAFAGELNRNSIFLEPQQTTFKLSNLTLDWDLGAASLLSSSSYAIFDNQDKSDFTDFLSTAIDANFGFPGVMLPSHAVQTHHAKTFSQEFRLISPSDQRVTWLGGLYYYRMDEVNSELDVSDRLYDWLNDNLGFDVVGTPFDVGPGPDIAFRDLDAHDQRRQFAAFGEATYHFDERITATFGARWFRYEQSSTDNAGGIFNGTPVLHDEKETSDHSQVFRFRVADQVTDDALLYALASQGYRTGGLNPLNPLAPPDLPQAFDPDKLWNYEIGWKTRWFDRRVKFDGAIFYIDWKDEQIQVSLPGGFTTITNAGKTTIKGIEIDFSVSPLDGLELGVGGSYIDAKLARDLIQNPDDPPADQILIGKSDDQLTGVPTEQGSVYAQWTFPLTSTVMATVRGDLQYVGETSRYFEHDVRVPAPADEFSSYGDYSLVNLRAGAEWNGFTVTVFAKNLTDERAVLFRGLQGTSITPTRDDIYVAQPRTIGVTISKAF